MKLILFDMDDTIVDADKAHIDSYTRAALKFGLKKPNVKKLRDLFGMQGVLILKKLYPGLSKKMYNRIYEERHRILMRDSKKYLKPLPGVINALKKLKKHYHLGLVTNRRSDEIAILLKTAGIDKELFDIFIGDDYVKRAKPAPDELILAQKLTLHKASYMVGDTIYDVMAGKRAKVKTIAVLTGNHSRAKLKKYKPYMIIRSVADLPRVLLKKR